MKIRNQNLTNITKRTNEKERYENKKLENGANITNRSKQNGSQRETKRWLNVKLMDLRQSEDRNRGNVKTM